MEAVLKVGGSLAEYPAGLQKLCKELASFAKDHKIIIVPGGGRFADMVRDFDKTYGLSDAVAHEMAVLAMDQFGLFLSDITPNSYVTYSLEELKNSAMGVLPIFLPSRFMFRRDPLEHSWDVTSDSIAAYIAGVLHAKKLILVTDVDGIFTENPKKSLDARLIAEISANQLLSWNKRTSVDKALPEILLKKKLDCYVVNGKHPKRIRAVLENEKSVYTYITV
ncbi:MAG: delta 1-pyrroline-5-carboxylate synthetase [Candidatus Bathyarchaeia archaeon]